MFGKNNRTWFIYWIHVRFFPSLSLKYIRMSYSHNIVWFYFSIFHHHVILISEFDSYREQTKWKAQRTGFMSQWQFKISSHDMMIRQFSISISVRQTSKFICSQNVTTLSNPPAYKKDAAMKMKKSRRKMSIRKPLEMPQCGNSEPRFEDIHQFFSPMDPIWFTFHSKEFFWPKKTEKKT